MSDPTTESIERLTREREKLVTERDHYKRLAEHATTRPMTVDLDVLKARVAALESQLSMAQPPTDRLGNAIDPERYGVYRDAAVTLSTYMAGVRSGRRDASWVKQQEKVWGSLIDRVNAALATDPSVKGSVH